MAFWKISPRVYKVLLCCVNVNEKKPHKFCRYYQFNLFIHANNPKIMLKFTDLGGIHRRKLTYFQR